MSTTSVPVPDDDDDEDEWAVGGMTTRGGNEVLGQNLPQNNLLHHKHMNWPGMESEPPRWRAGDWPPGLW
jgi:hypothetical protein